MRRAGSWAQRLALSATVSLGDRVWAIKLRPFASPGKRLRMRQWPMLACAACGQGGVEDYMVRPEVWALAAPHRAFLHVQCLEKQIGRSLTIEDFVPAPINTGVFVGYALGLRASATAAVAAPLQAVRRHAMRRRRRDTEGAA